MRFRNKAKKFSKKIDEVEQQVISNDEKTQNKYDRVEKALESEVNNLRKDFSARLDNDIQTLKEQVTNSTQQQ
jgi:predicted secreted Zn-dependent protease